MWYNTLWWVTVWRVDQELVINQNYVKMHGQQNIKKNVLKFVILPISPSTVYDVLPNVEPCCLPTDDISRLAVRSRKLMLKYRGTASRRADDMN
jgi:hypothetical protein